MSGYVAAGYGIPLLAIAAYGTWVIVRGRSLSRRAAAEAGQERVR